MSIDKYIPEFLLYCKKVKNLSPKTVLCYSETLGLLSSFLSKGFDLQENLATSFVKNLSTSGLNPASINRHIAACKQFFLYCVKNKYIDKNPFIWIRSRKKSRKIPVFLNADEMRELVEFGRDSNVYFDVMSRCIICVLCFTGIRRSELLSLRDEDVNLDEKEMIVFGKGRKERKVYFTNYCREVILKYLKLRGESKGQVFFLDEAANPCTNGTVNRVFSVLNASGVTAKSITPHVLRHSFATLMINSGVDVSYIQRLLGHSSIVSSDVYVHSNMSDIFKSYDKVFK